MVRVYLVIQRVNGNGKSRVVPLHFVLLINNYVLVVTALNTSYSQNSQHNKQYNEPNTDYDHHGNTNT